MSLKRCVRCKQKKALEEFPFYNSKRNSRRAICRDCNKNTDLEHRFGIPSGQYQVLFDAQNGCCAICGKYQSKFKYSLAVDHDRKTGVIRGLLCTRCNTDIETFINKKEQLEKYLKRSPQRMIGIYKQWLKIREAENEQRN